MTVETRSSGLWGTSSTAAELFGRPHGVAHERGAPPPCERAAMPFEIPDRWVWDCWIADDGDLFHLFYLNAPRALGDPALRHRNAVIGHATSTDLREWTSHGTVLEPGAPGEFDATATWTGCVVPQTAGWRMFYTGSVFLAPDAHTNVESIGAADSTDLHSWSKAPSPVLRADPRWYETLADGTWPEEAWRDPWVFFDGDLWHMLITSRAKRTEESADPRDLGVVGHATSRDLSSWTIGEPLSAPGAGFAHLEVLQALEFEGGHFALFSCDRTHLAGDRMSDRSGGVWVAPRDPKTGWCAIEHARLLHDESLYAARAVRDRAGRLSLIGFMNGSSTEEFGGRISDPIALVPDPDGWPSTANGTVAQ